MPVKLLVVGIGRFSLLLLNFDKDELLIEPLCTDFDRNNFVIVIRLKNTVLNYLLGP